MGISTNKATPSSSSCLQKFHWLLFPSSGDPVSCEAASRVLDLAGQRSGEAAFSDVRAAPQSHITICVAEPRQSSIKPIALKTLPEASNWTPSFHARQNSGSQQAVELLAVESKSGQGLFFPILPQAPSKSSRMSSQWFYQTAE